LVHCLRSSGNCRALSAWVSACSFRGCPRCAITLTINVRAPRSTLSLTHSKFVFMMSALASPASVVRGPLLIHLETMSKVVSLSHKYSRSIPGGVGCSVRATAACSGLIELTPSSSRLTRTTRHLCCCWRQTLPAPFLLCVLIHLPPMFLLENHSILDVLLLFLTRISVRGLVGLSSTRLCYLLAPMPLSNSDLLYRRPG
jgi:hypothetical protein